MYVKRNLSVWASEIAEYLNRELHGRDFLVKEPSTYSHLRSSSILYLESDGDLGKFVLDGCSDILFLTPKPLPEDDRYAFIVSECPKLDFVLTVHEFMVRHIERSIDESAIIEKGASIGRNVYIGANARIGPDVRIDNNVVILNNVVLSGSIHIGSDATIKDNAVIGSEGYVFVYNNEKKPLHVPHLGEIIIGERVWVGSNSTIERAEIIDTVIEQDVKIDDLVHIGGGCRIGAFSMLTAGTVLSRNVEIGKRCWLAPNVSVKEGIFIESHSIVGIGSVVLHNLPGRGVFIGTPARLSKKVEMKDNERDASFF